MNKYSYNHHLRIISVEAATEGDGDIQDSDDESPYIPCKYAYYDHYSFNLFTDIIHTNRLSRLTYNRMIHSLEQMIINIHENRHAQGIEHTECDRCIAKAEYEDYEDNEKTEDINTNDSQDLRRVIYNFKKNHPIALEETVESPYKELKSYSNHILKKWVEQPDYLYVIFDVSGGYRSVPIIHGIYRNINRAENCSKKLKNRNRYLYCQDTTDFHVVELKTFKWNTDAKVFKLSS